jgi:hypothetical protein
MDKEALFIAKVVIADTPLRGSPCEIWIASTNVKGYGKFHTNGNKWELAHVWAWKREGNDYPGGELIICHHCDIPPCVNTQHMYLGTRENNMRDRLNRSAEWRPGIPSLSDSVREEIRNAYTGERGQQAELALQFGVQHETIRRVLYEKGIQYALSISDEQVLDIRARVVFGRGGNVGALAAEFNVPYGTLYQIASGRTRKNINI